jgi:selenocysteine lyase/cysteine desulfurase
MALQHRGFRVRRVPTDESGCPREDLIADALDGEAVRALAISAVQYSTGYRADLPALGELCRDRGILFCVDAIQALGAVVLHPREAHVDVLASGGQKWLCGAWGSGFAYVARELQDRFPPPMASWLGVRGGGRLEEIGEARMEWVDGARRFELATVGLQDHLTLARSVEILLEMGVDRITRYLHELHGAVLEWAEGRSGVAVITPLEPSRRAGILTLAVPEPHRVLRELEEANVTCAVRGGALRLSPHYYNEIGEMEEVVRILDAVVPE